MEKNIRYNSNQTSDFKFSYDFEVHFDECDQAGIVHNSNFIKYFERSRTAYVHNLGLKWNTSDIGKDYYVVIGENYCKYISPAMFEDRLTTFARITNVKNSSYRFEYSIVRFLDKTNDKFIKICEGFSTIIKVSEDYKKPSKLSDSFKKLISDFEDIDEKVK